MDASGDLIAADATSVKVFPAPFSTNETPSATITNGISSPVALVLDAAGNLFVANSNSVTVYAPPFTSASSPMLTITTGISGPAALLIH